MSDMAQRLTKYLDELGIQGVRLQPVPEACQKFPVFIGQAYELFRVQLFGKAFLLLLRDGSDQATPAEAEKQAQIVRSKLGIDVLFVLGDLKSFERKRWVEKGLAFTVPGRHFYCPVFLIDSRERANRPGNAQNRNREAISSSTQALLFFYLQKHSGNWSLAQWADALHYTRMTITRSRQELEAADLCKAVARGRSIELHFTSDRRALWEKAEPMLRSPVARIRHVQVPNRNELQLLGAGLSALSDASMLADDPEPTYALSSSAYRAAVEEGLLVEQPIQDEDSIKIEQWSYAPSLLSIDGSHVDCLSLYMSLRDSPDERVQAALHETLEALPW